MKFAEDIKRYFQRATLSINPDRHEVIFEKIQRAQEQSKITAPASHRPLYRSNIMRSPIIKVAAAAVIVVAIVLPISIWDKTTPAAYALEQTVEANNSVRYIHVREIVAGHEDEPKEFWLETDEDGQVKNVRISLPPWDAPGDGAKVVVWKENKAQVWIKSKNVLVTIGDKAVADKMLELAVAYNPKLAVERLYKQKEEGKVEIQIEEPSDKSKPIIVTATDPGRRKVLSVDPATKLVTTIKFYQLKDGEYQYQSMVELDGYNQPIDAKVFTLDEVPADVIRIDQTIQELGLEQGNLTDEEVAAEVVRQFFEALIAENYARASQLFGGVPVDLIQKQFGQLKFIRIISVGPVGPHPIPETRGLVVPCTVEIEHDGEKAEWKLDRIGVREVYNKPGRWTIFGGI